MLRTTLADLVTAWNEDPRGRAQVALRDLGDVKTRLARQEELGVNETVAQTRSDIANRGYHINPRIQSRHPSLGI